MSEFDNVIPIHSRRRLADRQEARIAREKRKTDMELVKKYGETAITAARALLYYSVHGAPEVQEAADSMLTRTIEAIQSPPPTHPPA